MTTIGIREDSKEEEPEREKENEEKEKEEKEKEKEDKAEDSLELEPKEKEKERVTLQEMRATGLRMNGKEMSQRIGRKAIGPMKMRQHGNPKAGMNGKKIIYYDEYGYFQGKGKKGRKGKGKGKKGHGPQQDQGKGQGDGKGEANHVNPSHSSVNPARSRQLYLRHRMLPVSL